MTYTRPGPDGLQIRAGDTPVIPAGAIRMSLDPRQATGRFTDAGVSMFVRMLLGDRAAQGPDGIDESLGSLSEAADLLLANSALLSDLDLESDAGGKAAVERLETKKESIEWFALVVTVFAQIARDAISDNDPTKAAWATQQAMLAHSVLTFETLARTRSPMRLICGRQIRRTPMRSSGTKH